MHAAHVSARSGPNPRDVEHDTNDRHQRIRERAYVLWENSDRTGSQDHYWLLAEREIDEEHAAPALTAAGKTIVFPERAPRPPRRTPPPDRPDKKKTAKPKTKAKSKPKTKPKPKESFRASR